MTKERLLFFVIFLEGYIVLSAELLAMRQIIPFVGSGTDTVSIIIAAVLMPLAIGYFHGGQYTRKAGMRRNHNIRKKLLKNIFIATFFLIPGLSYVTITIFFETLNSNGITDRLTATSLYAITFLVVPIFLLAQTIPLVSNFYKKQALSQATGKMLSFSTIGSFMGAIFSTLVLMSLIGVFSTVIITLLCLPALYVMLSKKQINEALLIMCGLGMTAIFLNSPNIMRQLNIIEANQYHTVQVTEDSTHRFLLLNNNNSSAYDIQENTADTKRANAFKYVKHMNKTFIDPIKKEGPQKSILIIGAGGFTIGLNDKKNDYIYLDINPNLKQITERHFLKRKLGSNKTFLPVPARGFLSQSYQKSKKFDLIVLDTYTGNHSIPEHLVTAEFFAAIRNSLKDGGIVTINFITSPTFDNAFSIRLDNTLRSAFPLITRQIVEPYDGWSSNGKKDNTNVVYTYHHKEALNGIYTDDKNHSYADHGKQK